MSAHEAQQIASFGYDATRVHTVGSAIALEEFSGVRGGTELRRKWGVTRPRFLLTAGGTWENKRIDRVIEGIAPLREEVALVVAGRDIPTSPYHRGYLERLARERGVELHCVGEVSRADLLGALREADLYVQGSSYEGFGLTLLEGMATGLPFVAYPTGAAPELASAGGGSIASSPSDFAARVRERLTESAAQPQAVSERARRAAQKWSWNESVERYAEVYRRLVGT